MSGEAAIRACALFMGGALAAVALSRQPVLTAAALVLAGAVWSGVGSVQHWRTAVRARLSSGPVARGLSGGELAGLQSAAGFGAI